MEGVTWDEANRLKDANVSATGDQVVLMGAASKGIIQRGYQHNATVYKAPYAKNPFDSVTDDDLNEYKKNISQRSHGDCELIKIFVFYKGFIMIFLFAFLVTDTDYSESEALSSLQISSNQPKSPPMSPPSSQIIHEQRIITIETKHAPKPSQPEVVLSDGKFWKRYYIRLYDFSSSLSTLYFLY